MHQIPWIEYSEEEIQDVFQVLFKLRGYRVTNLHKADRRGEKGVDLECVKSGETEKIIIAVKKKPGKSDIQQLNEFVRRDSKNKIYVYISEPSADFRFEMDKMRDLVSFWDSEKITSELFNTDLKFYSFCILENYVEKHAFEISEKIMQFYLNYEEMEYSRPKPLDNQMIRILWQMKDRSASIHRILNIIQLLFEDTSPFFLDDKNTKNLVYAYLKNLVNLSPQFESLKNLIFEFMEKYPKHFAKYCDKTKGRSNWMAFSRHIPSCLPGYLSLTFDNDEPISRIEQKGVQYGSNDIGYILGDIARIFGMMSYWYEYTIDELLNIALS